MFARFTPFHSVLLLSLYFAQGFPAGLVAHVLPPVMRENGVPLEYIGFIKMLALPWVLKFIWAPWVDRTNPLGWGWHRGWILLMIFWSMLMLLLMTGITPEALSTIPILLFCLLVLGLNLGAATQDIATDGLAVKLLPPPLRGWGNAIQVGGYKVGMIVCASLLLVSIDLIGWSASIGLMVVVLALCLIPIAMFREARAFPEAHSHDRVSETGAGNRIAKDPAITHPGGQGWRLPLAIYRGFLRQKGIWLWVAVLLLFKLPDSLASGMIKPMLVDVGLSLSEIGSITLLASLAGVMAVFAGGGLYDRLGPKGCLAGLGLLQGVSLASLSLIAGGELSMGMVLALSLFEQLIDSMSTVALFAVMMHYCREDHEGADYSLQACVQVMFAGLASVFSGVFASIMGYSWLFWTAAGVSFAVVPLVWWHFSRYPDVQTEWRRSRQQDIPATV